MCIKVKNNSWVSHLDGGTFTHWGRVTHICVGNLTTISSDNGLLPGRRQAITWTNVGILLIGPLGTNFSEILIGIQTFSFTKMHLKMSSAKWRPFCFGLNVLSARGKPVYQGYPAQAYPAAIIWDRMFKWSLDSAGCLVIHARTDIQAYKLQISHSALSLSEGEPVNNKETNGCPTSRPL